MKSPTFVKQGLLGLFWREESNNRALFAKLLRHRKLCTSFNILERLISENFLSVKSTSCVCHTEIIVPFWWAYVKLCTFENRALWCITLFITLYHSEFLFFTLCLYTLYFYNSLSLWIFILHFVPVHVCFDARCAAYCVAVWWTWMALRLVVTDSILTVLIAYL